jgi:hypothetical protein
MVTASESQTVPVTDHAHEHGQRQRHVESRDKKHTPAGACPGLLVRGCDPEQPVLGGQDQQPQVPKIIAAMNAASTNLAAWVTKTQ